MSKTGSNPHDMHPHMWITNRDRRPPYKASKLASHPPEEDTVHHMVVAHAHMNTLAVERVVLLLVSL